MIKVLKNASVYSPEPLGKKDILIIADKIVRIADSITEYDNVPDVEVFDFSDKIVTPGFIDLHVHVTGGGGEQGPTSRVPEINLSELVESGITTVVGLMGTDSVTRSLENLLAKCRALDEGGITTYMLTGSYTYPGPTLFETMERDIMLIDKIIGVKIAVSDHRGSNPSGDDLIEIGTQARRGGMLSCKPGLVTMHMGDGKGKLDPVFYAVEHSDVPIKHFLPTHTSRNPALLDQGIEYVKAGGTIDITAGINDAALLAVAKAVKHCLDVGADPERITLSSDSCGSLPRFNEKGECISLTYVSPSCLKNELKTLVEVENLPLETALGFITKNPARVLEKSAQKGNLIVGADADIAVLDKDLTLDSLFAMGKTAMLKKEVLMKGKFEA